ncbi:class II glutamine amidotransferase [Bifidobacterium choloepi]|uniref:Class II glutamine amidotransferase n=1 Tax=Bifidobacterium choloepi TaxID=2614131 RepID=A0A6I5N9N0_9BIFI|nr:class II glutamine amidotransferase [Bifidobacterium choloepi]NEG70501.1 class II glutamine amidotransferase [Bifidobacterium choloepi]
MCRLLGYATASFNTSLQEVLGLEATAQYRGLSEIHNDGWGAALVNEPDQPGNTYDGGEPTPETGMAIYRNTVAARFDSLFDDLASIRARGALWHLRLASSHLPLILENQQPFYASGLSFIHNGDISDANGVNIVHNRDYPISHNLVEATGGRSDSAIFFAIVLEYLGFGFELPESVAQAVRELRCAYPLSSYNCMVQSKDQFVALHACGRDGTPARVQQVYDHYGRGADAKDYRMLRYRGVKDDEGNVHGVVVASTGFGQPAADGWKDLPNNQMIIASNRTGEFRIAKI